MKESASQNILTASDKNPSRSRQTWLPGAILAFIMLGGVLFAFRDIMAGDACLISAWTAGTLVILVRMGLNSESTIGRIACLGVYGAGAAGFLFLILFVVRGFLDTANRMIMLWNLRFDTDGQLFQVSGGMFSSAVFWTLLAIPLSAFLASRIRRRRMGLLTVLLSGALLFAFSVGRTAGWMTVLLFGLGIFGAFLYVAAPGRILQVRGALCLLLAVVSAFGLAAVSHAYHGMDALGRWKQEIRSRAEQLRYGEDSLPKGNLYRAQELLSSDEQTLQLSLEQPQELYLRGFVGSVYQKNQWKPLVWADYQDEYEGMLEWLHSQEFVPMAQYAKFDQVDGQYAGRQTKTVQVEVKNVGAYRKYVYFPVSVSSWKDGGVKAEKDAQFLSRKLFGAREYTFDMIDQVPTAEKFLTPLWLEDPETSAQEEFCNTESVYHSFVQDTYLNVDSKTKELIQEDFFPEGEEQEDFAKVTRQIRRVLRAKAEYTQDPVKLPAGESLIDWFLEDAKEGNAVHFASAAVLAYRTAGYPARYVEGYHLTADQAEKMAREGQKTLTLTGQDAHAWVEVYLFGAGWLPVEVTPGMYTESYTEQIVEGKPSYQIGTHQEDEGLNLEEGENRSQGERAKEPEKKERIPYAVLAGLLLTAYLLLCLFLLLEAQRALRICLRKRSCDTEKEADREAGRLEYLLRIAGVKGNYDHPFEMVEQVENRFPGIRGADYRRAVELMQKETFGGYALREGERYTLKRFEERLRESLYRKKGLFSGLWLRYWHAV